MQPFVNYIVQAMIVSILKEFAKAIHFYHKKANTNPPMSNIESFTADIKTLFI